MTQKLSSTSQPPASGMVHQGLEEWLFLTGGSNFVIELYQRDAGHLPDVSLRAWRDAIINRKKRCDSMGIIYVHLIAPEKITIYNHKLASAIVDADLAPAIRLGDMLKDHSVAQSYLSLVKTMRAQRDEADLYWRTDTHWTPTGFKLAYRALCEHLKLDEKPVMEELCIAEEARLMDLGAKLDPPVWEFVRNVSWLKYASRVYENKVTSLLENPIYGGSIHVGSRVIYKNYQAPNKKKVMLFGDSFSSVGANALTAMLAETFEHVDFIWSANVDWGLVLKERPHYLITQMAERYMATSPRAGVNLSALELRQSLVARKRLLGSWLQAKKKLFQPIFRLP